MLVGVVRFSVVLLGGEDFISDRKVVRLVRKYSYHLTIIILRGVIFGYKGVGLVEEEGD